MPQIVAVVSVFFICVSVLSFALKTHPDMRVPALRNVTVQVRTRVLVALPSPTELTSLYR